MGKTPAHYIMALAMSRLRIKQRESHHLKPAVRVAPDLDHFKNEAGYPERWYHVRRLGLEQGAASEVESLLRRPEKGFPDHEEEHRNNIHRCTKKTNSSEASQIIDSHIMKQISLADFHFL